MGKSEIYSAVRLYLNREDETALPTSLLDVWFQIAHRNAQRPHLFKSAEDTYEVTLVNGTNSYAIPSNWRQANANGLAMLVNPADDTVVKFFNKTNYATIQQRRYTTDPASLSYGVAIQDYEGYAYAINEDMFELWPPVSNSIAGYEFHVPYIKWLPIPGGSDWFTENAFDFILYSMLCESILVIGQPESRLDRWMLALNNARNLIYAADISAQVDGQLKMRGA